MMMKRELWKHAITYLFLGAAGFLIWRGDIARFAAREVGQPVLEAEGTPVILSEVYGPAREICGEVRKGDRLAGLLTKAGVAPPLADLLLGSLSGVFDLRGARPGDTFKVVVDPEMTVVEFQYDRVNGESYRVAPEGDALSATVVESLAEPMLLKREGEVANSLFESVRRVGGDAEEVDLFARVFSGSFDFFTETRKGDTFSYVLEAEYEGETLTKAVRVLFAEYHSKARGKTLTAYYYQPEGQSKGAYYSADGDALARRFLKCPLPVSRITSRFSHGRLHPVLKVRRPHLGVDYAAPTGTPVSVVADGVVVLAGRHGGMGNCVKVRHGSGVETWYGHLSRFGRGVRPGLSVAQGEVIGYVGATGLATGPHLDFRIEQNGTFVDPLRFDSPGGPPLPRTEIPAFQIARDRIAELRVALPANVPQPTLAAAGATVATPVLSTKS